MTNQPQNPLPLSIVFPRPPSPHPAGNGFASRKLAAESRKNGQGRSIWHGVPLASDMPKRATWAFAERLFRWPSECRSFRAISAVLDHFRRFSMQKAAASRTQVAPVPQATPGPRPNRAQTVSHTWAAPVRQRSNRNRVASVRNTRNTTGPPPHRPRATAPSPASLSLQPYSATWPGTLAPASPTPGTKPSLKALGTTSVPPDSSTLS